MKTYEKPKLIALSLTGNNMLCSSCAHDVIGSNAETELVETLRDFFGIINITESSFASNEDCEEQEDIQTDSYCKFTGAESGGTVVINS